MTNPYLHDRMIQDPECFFGRQWELQRIYDRLSSMQSCSIVGERRIGKSSLLYCAKLPEVQARHKCDWFTNYVFAYVDMQMHPRTRPTEFLTRVLESMADEVGDRILFDIGVETSYQAFARQVKQLHKLGLKIVVLFDEFDMIQRNQAFDVDFFNLVRSLANRGLMTYVTASQGKLIDLGPSDRVGSPFFNVSEEIRLGLMTENEISELILKPSERLGESFEGEVATVLKWAGRHPFYVQIACRHLWDVVKRDGRDAEGKYLMKAKEGFTESARQHFQYVWDHLTLDEQNSIVQLARFGSIDLFQAKGLAKKCILVKSDGSFEFACDAFREFVAQKPLVLGGPSTADMTQPSAAGHPPAATEVVSATPLHTGEAQPSSPDRPFPGIEEYLLPIGIFLVIAVATLTRAAYLLRDNPLLVLIVFVVLLLLLGFVFAFVGLLTQAIREQTWFQTYLKTLEKIPGLGAFIGRLNTSDSDEP